MALDLAPLGRWTPRDIAAQAGESNVSPTTLKKLPFSEGRAG
jgi:hypothetical protein